ncbi:HEAT repeat domain-containing protein [filamentous cyanobacterium LEGE 11480]|uniref:HEAT repeat domain-containing protein n=1 Tax=Romeriopsis navalis LEGE 11480 TaxID=2777977 RepID=A0A928VM51_9CYAN|nr:HEAT repeat domain-containing protein [Romeriopsis navalis]MBE9030855.1 HEAT repeat domain-containing protein [Romeriopsis navalis LEGE 11480]
MSITPESAKALLSAEDYGARIRGINELRELPAIEAFELVQLVLQDGNERVRYAAISLLATVGQVDLVKSLELLRVGLQDSEMDVKAAAADSIAGLKLREAYDDLRDLYQETTDWIIRFSIVAALGELGEPRGFEILEHAIQTKDALLVPAAIGAMGELGDPRAIKFLLPYVSDEDWQIRHRVLQSLLHFDTPETKAAIQTLAQDSESHISEQAQQALG